MKRVVGSFFLIGFFIACAAPDEGDTVKPFQASSSTKKDTTKDTPDDEETTVLPPTAVPVTPVAPVDAGGGSAATTYVGTLDTTPTVPFGGAPYCNYNVALKSITIEISALPSGQVIGATVKDTMVEGVGAKCTLAPAPASQQSFSFTTFQETADGAQLAFSGAAANHPATKLVVDIKKTGASYTAAAVWVRTDQKPPLDWTVKTEITLGAR